MTIANQKNIRALMKPSEHNEQAGFFDWLLTFKERQYPEVHPLFFSVPNGANLAGNEKQKVIQMRRLKAEGLTPGVADTIFLSGRGGYLGLALEFKTPDRMNQSDGGLTPNQREFLKAARAEGYCAQVAYGADHGQEIVENYLGMEKTKDLILFAQERAEIGDLAGCLKTLEEITHKW